MTFSRIQVAIVSVLVFILVLTLPIPAILAHSELSGVLQNAAHGPLFALATCISAWLTGNASIRTFLWVVLFMVAVAILSEFLQMLTSRSVSWGDIKNNMLGVTLGSSLWLLCFSRRAQIPRFAKIICFTIALASAVILSIPVWQGFSDWKNQHQRVPVLFDMQFKNIGKMTESLGADSEVEIVPTKAGLKVKILEGKLPGIVVTNFYPDWSAYQYLVIDVRNQSNEPLHLGIHVRDQISDHDFYDRFNASIIIKGNGEQRVRYQLSDIAAAPRQRVAQLTNMALLALFRERGGAEEFMVTAIYLE